MPLWCLHLSRTSHYMGRRWIYSSTYVYVCVYYFCLFGKEDGSMKKVQKERVMWCEKNQCHFLSATGQKTLQKKTGLGTEMMR